MAPPRFGFLASGLRPQGLPPPSEVRRLGPRLEELGWDSVWVADRLASPAPGSPLLEGVAMAAAYAALTARLRVGIGVLVAPTRHPYLLAKQLATVDYLAGGRLVAGLGIGINPADYASVEVPYRARGRRQDELIAALRRTWADGRSGDVWLEPGPHRPGGPPLWIGGTSEAALRRSGRLGDGWLAYQVAAGQVPGMLAAIRRHAEAAGRDPAAIECGLLVPAHVRADRAAARREAQESFSRRWGRAIPDEVIEHLCVVGEPDECVQKVAAFAAAGVGELVLNPQSQTRDPVGDAEQLMADLVAPARKALP
jgi:alkanesulfonate monooxygenase SsuD/methylene tetrahydromethanopterin reductase-like flavin-dependent oxidoreductase (luciferase family)